jgi:N-acetylmuramoyl-L-alanine amidase
MTRFGLSTKNNLQEDGNRVARSLNQLLAVIFASTLLTLSCKADVTRGDKYCRIAIDIGHTLNALGAISASGISEYHFNRRIAKLLRSRLNQGNLIEAMIINESGSDIELLRRTEIAEEMDADFFISLHHDSVQPHYLTKSIIDGKERFHSDRFRGFSLFVSRKGAEPEKSIMLAEIIGSHLLEAGFVPSLHHAEEIAGENRELLDERLGIYNFDELVILRKSRVPAVLLECGVIVNREEERLLLDPHYQYKLIRALYSALEHGCNQRETQKSKSIGAHD